MTQQEHFAVIHKGHTAFYLSSEYKPGQPIRATWIIWPNGSQASIGQRICCGVCGEVVTRQDIDTASIQSTLNGIAQQFSRWANNKGGKAEG